MVSVGDEEAGETCTILPGAGHRGEDRDRDRGDDAADDDRDLLELNELVGGVDRQRALALRIARVGDELAAMRAAGVVEIAERHFDRFGAGLAIFAGRAGQLHHDADGDRAIGGARRRGEGESERRRRQKNAALHALTPCSAPTGRLLHRTGLKRARR